MKFYKEVLLFGYNDYSKSYVHLRTFKTFAELEELKKQILNQKNGNNG
jgi:UDP-3-O-[3-hydroxymyristoyl] glucosamine N-acyltransferase